MIRLARLAVVALLTIIATTSFPSKMPGPMGVGATDTTAPTAVFSLAGR